MQQPYAKIQFDPSGSPFANEFDDVYFSKEDGAAESQYVFVENNQLWQRWSESAGPHFVIAETGLGTGLNFLVVAEQFLSFRQQCPNSPLSQLHFISTEKFPLTHSDLIKALQPFAHFSLQPFLTRCDLTNVQGCHRFETVVNGTRFVLDVWIGDVLNTLPQWHAGNKGVVDAWFLDGFAPSKNPDMWQDSLFSHMRRLSKSTATFATFTAAGFVKRGLQQAGFNVEKRKGFGRKRDMLAGRVNETDTTLPVRHPQPFYNRSVETITPPTAQGHPVTIIGGGLAAANLCYALAKRGISSHIVVQDSHMAMGASGNPQGGFYPQLTADASNNSQIQLASFLYAKRVYQQLLSQGFDFAHEWCGALLLNFSAEIAKRQNNLIDKGVWPSTLLYPVNAKQAREIAQIPLERGGIFIPSAGWVSPPELVSALFKAAEALITVDYSMETSVDGVNVGANEVVELHCTSRGKQSVKKAATVVFATGHHSAHINHINNLPVALTRGQVEQIKTNAQLTPLSTVLCHKGYMTPVFNGYHALGSTYVKNDIDTHYRQDETQQNLSTHRRCLPEAAWLDNINSEGQGRAAIRCSTPDHLPLVGAMPDVEEQANQYRDYGGKRPQRLPQQPANLSGVFVLTGLGSRGLTTSPLMADILASQLLNEPLPMANTLLSALNPNRYLIRALKRGT
ncbi:bifunctional tRNA (5-methylaminomethyl-2-thiouridine)(34)-methyltransferase MnmD/FAD-dependent 5-carboxymethylaminomethyl-2-thiouridine(34) oxidoreductase MnmC [Alteromonas oceanisediminis]|uniref:bifunctional tRNA (5-methylaminomethyl-2-thiouridine)(34)-methyltransferase MnmD/FAD-dependent 5-carboxymethylaminomethyl-2-thiouridine(34) oxidoreductase MnmC n=1 Tax=Alteromonas oceanisediminis TaxID=2836180 RepID=UPI001BD94084|nr:bifunctional tRNA (5-methylaminomethyl-2-thiouridine)(34)-methyltransferase MnmD/FAD-dependent 5-carboxymethylaminomethyl-2-thiouridine(34) oxidoreductase MnmC [Alteromonas oceanisediminis]MBT0587432.1 bifunctional tRNA (5-methylaminomethyl-2-thiouridine)(34)-methyltransferase MnmD/FAD-dependent 5-carboxymethylaminomethyl-2-thiouridine(34) oxidoreductase MnmC [Alteromonas oceanisediminis]